MALQSCSNRVLRRSCASVRSILLSTKCGLGSAAEAARCVHTTAQKREAVSRPRAAVRRPERVAVGVSGGVDSSVAALLLLQQGYAVEGVHMRNWDASDEVGEAVCTNDADAKSAAEVCAQLSIPLRHADHVADYWTGVFEPFLDSYRNGETPNPDILCNRIVKFGTFMEAALRTGVDRVATGHYARLSPEQPDLEGAGAPQLLRAVDNTKDQSYFLAGVRGEALRRSLFPLGELPKSRVREIAAEAGLCTASRRDSYGICFIGERRLSAFLPQYIDLHPGDFVSVDDGSVVAQHSGVELFTPGQNARIASQKHKWFVVGSDVGTRKVFVAPSTDHPALMSEHLDTPASSFNWIAGEAPAEVDSESGWRCRYRIRHRTDELGFAQVSRAVDQPGVLRVAFDRPQRAAAVGQQVALYGADDEVCFGGGAISAVGPTLFDQGKPTPEVWRN